jgi:hypothetical protein
MKVETNQSGRDHLLKIPPEELFLLEGVRVTTYEFN